MEYQDLPNISSSVLEVSGRTLSPFAFKQIDVWYERPPAPLSLGQIDVTYCYDVGDIPVALVVPPPAPGSFYPQNNSFYEWESCEDPYLTNPDKPRRKALPVGVIPLSSPTADPTRRTLTPFAVAKQWLVIGDSFKIQVDLTDVLAKNGAGVYTVLVWGESGEETVALTNFPIFVD